MAPGIGQSTMKGRGGGWRPGRGWPRERLASEGGSQCGPLHGAMLSRGTRAHALFIFILNLFYRQVIPLWSQYFKFNR